MKKCYSANQNIYYGWRIISNDNHGKDYLL